MNSQLDLTTIFCSADDFCKVFEPEFNKKLLQKSTVKSNKQNQKISLSEVMAIVMFFHVSAWRDFKHYYLSLLSKKDFPNLPSYSRFVEIMEQSIVPLICYIQFNSGNCSGVSFVDSTPLPVCHSKRSSSNKVFKNIAKVGKSTMGWFFGFKLSLLINTNGELLSFYLGTGNQNDRKAISFLTKKIYGKLFADKGYLSQKLFEELLKKGIKLVTQLKKKMKPMMMDFQERLLLKKRSLIESVFHSLKNVLHIDHTRHRKPTNFMVNLLSGLATYCLYPNKPKIRTAQIYPILATK